MSDDTSGRRASRRAAVGRRGFLAGAGLAALGAAAGCGTSASSGTPPRNDSRGRPSERPQSAVTHVEYAYSRHRRSTVELFFAYPSGVRDTRGLPMVLYLHGRDGAQPTPLPYGTLDALESAYRRGTIPRFGFVGVDGGFNSYWYDGSANGDLLSMITEELPEWLRSRGLGDQRGMPFAAGGLSTGGFGALNYAIERERAGMPLSGLSLLAPALPVTWQQMSEKQGFATEQQWREHDPLRRVSELGDVPVGVWFGDSDYFRDGVMRLIEQHSNMPVVTTVPGGHEPAVFDAVGDGVISFLGGAVRQVS